MMNLSDRAKAITAEDLIRRYDLDGLKKYKKAISTIGEGLTRTNANLENYVEAVTKDIKELQNQVDGNITTWFFNGVPSPSSSPANEWNTEEEKNNHLGDLYYDQDKGYAYRWALVDNVYQWIEIKDTDVKEALALAEAAKDAADSKRRIFVPREINGVLVEEPTTPYDAGDIWLYKGELYRCIRSREEGEWNTADWVDDMIYTDDTTANQAITDLGNFKEQVQITYVPNKVFTETNNSINSTIQAVQVAVSKKNTIFREQPTTPYIVGDVYIQNEKIYVCKTARETGDYSSEDWELDLDATQYATKTQIEQTDERIRLVASSVDGKLNKGEVISEINVSPEAIELTTNRFSLESDHLNIAHNGEMEIISDDIYDNSSFVIKNSDGTLETRFGASSIGMGTPNQQYTNEKVILEDGRYSELVTGADYQKTILLDNTIHGKEYEIREYIDENGYHYFVNGIDILNRFSNVDINTKTEVGQTSANQIYIQTTGSNGEIIRPIFYNKGVNFQKFVNGKWENIWQLIESSYGNNGYVKFPDGFMIQWKYLSVTAGGTAWGNVYYSDHAMGNWLTPFTVVYFAKAHINALTYWCTENGYNNTSAGTVRCFRPNNSTGTAGIKIMAIGKWK